MSEEPTPYTDIRLIPMTAQHHAALTSEDAVEILRAVRFVIQAYDKSPPLTFQQAITYVHDVEWWRDQISDL
jgi:hypothetical protein